MWSPEDTASRRRVGLVAAALGLAPLGAVTVAHADDPTIVAAPLRRSMTERAGFTVDVRACVGAARAEFTQRDDPVADFNALSIAGALRFGWFLGQHVLLGAEASGAWHRSVGGLHISDASYFSSQGQPRGASYGVVAPLGVFVEVYPLARHGVYASLGGGVGLIDLPRFSDDDGGLLSGYSLELGYELSQVAKVGPAPFVRYSYWAGEADPISSEHPDGLASRELQLGLRWSFWTPEWR